MECTSVFANVCSGLYSVTCQLNAQTINIGCAGGSSYYVMEYAAASGLYTSADYPYTSYNTSGVLPVSGHFSIDLICIKLSIFVFSNQGGYMSQRDLTNNASGQNLELLVCLSVHWERVGFASTKLRPGDCLRKSDFISKFLSHGKLRILFSWCQVRCIAQLLPLLFQWNLQRRSLFVMER